MNARLVWVTHPSLEDAKSLAHTLVDQKYCACVNLIPRMQSVYAWQGKVESSQEVVMVCKTIPENVPKLMEKIKALHPYDVPCIVSLVVDQGLPAYLDWICQSTVLDPS